MMMVLSIFNWRCPGLNAKTLPELIPHCLPSSLLSWVSQPESPVLRLVHEIKRSLPGDLWKEQRSAVAVPQHALGTALVFLKIIFSFAGRIAHLAAA